MIVHTCLVIKVVGFMVFLSCLGFAMHLMRKNDLTQVGHKDTFMSKEVEAIAGRNVVYLMMFGLGILWISFRF